MAVLLLMGQAMAQHAGLSVPIEGVLSTPAGEIRIINVNSEVTPRESLLGDPNNEWARGTNDRELYRFNVEWGGVDGVSARRNFSQERVTAKGSAFNTGVRETLTEGFEVSPFSGMNFALSKQRTETLDLANVSLGASQVETMGLSQAYGSGATAGTVGFNRKVTETYAPTETRPFSAMELTKRTSEDVFALNQGFLALGQPASIGFSHSYTTVDQKGAPLRRSTGDSLTLGMGLWAGTKLTAAYDQILPGRDADLSKIHRALSLSRETEAGAAAFSHDYVSQLAGGTSTASESNSFAVPFLLNGTGVAMSYTAASTFTNDTRMTDKRAASFATKLNDNDVTASWDRDLQFKSNQENRTENMALLLPLDFFGEKLTVDFRSNLQQVGDTTQKLERVANLDLPLTRLREGAKFAYNVTSTEDAKNPFKRVRTATLGMPLAISGSPVSTQLQQVTTNAPDGTYGQFNADIGAPISLLGARLNTSERYVSLQRPDGSQQYQFHHKTELPLNIGALSFSGRTITERPVEGDERTSRVASIVTPAVPLPLNSSFQADLTRNTGEDGSENRVTHMVMKASPASRVTLTADYTTNQTTTEEHKTKRHSRTVDASYALTDRLSLNARYLDREQLDKGPLINRTMVLQHTKDKPEDLALRAAIAHTLDGSDYEQSPELLKLVDIEFGDPKILGFDLEYREYDEQKNTALGEPTIGFGVKHGTTGAVNWEFGYEDSKSRPAPHRRYGLGLPVSGNSMLSLGFSQNAMDPTAPASSPSVRMAECYDATLSQKLPGDIALDLGYRYLDYQEPASVTNPVAQYLQVKVAGGTPEGVGVIAVGYASGDFITDAALRKNPEHVPHSVLSLSYDKQWSDAGKLTLQFDHKNMPDDRISTLEDAYEGKVQFEYRF